MKYHDIYYKAEHKDNADSPCIYNNKESKWLTKYFAQMFDMVEETEL